LKRRILNPILRIADWPLAVFVALAGWLLKVVRRAGVEHMPLSRNALFAVGVFPVRQHYYEPLVDRGDLLAGRGERNLPGIDWNVSEQLDILRSFRSDNELSRIPRKKPATREFYVDNGAFEAGDAEYFYHLIRLRRPKNIIEVGSGQSTLLAAKAIAATRSEIPDYVCKHVCIEPYEAPWLEQIGVSVVRKRVEHLGTSFFSGLGRDDILFIDSSHVIRPRGDVLFEYLELLPSLNAGVIVHIHDIFSPRDYPDDWILDKVLFWNEQYLLEAFLTSNKDWKIIGALNYLRHHHFDELRAKSPFLTERDEPGSFYIQKRTG